MNFKDPKSFRHTDFFRVICFLEGSLLPFFADLRLRNFRLRVVTLNNFVVSLNRPQSITSLSFTGLPRSPVGFIIVVMFSGFRSLALNYFLPSSVRSSSFETSEFGWILGGPFKQAGPFHHRLSSTSSEARHPLEPTSAGFSTPGKLAPALHIGQLVDFLYSVLYELLEFPVRLDLIERCGAVSPAECFFYAQHLFQGFLY